MWTIIRHFFDPKFRPEEPNLKVIVSQEREREREVFDRLSHFSKSVWLNRATFLSPRLCFEATLLAVSRIPSIVLSMFFRRRRRRPGSRSLPRSRSRSSPPRTTQERWDVVVVEYKITQNMGSCCGTVVKVDAFFTEDLGSNLVIASFGSFTKRWLKTKNITSVLC